MTNLQKLRLLVGDPDKVCVADQFGVGDDTKKYFKLKLFPIRTDTEVITLDNVAQTRTTHYTLDLDTGLVTMVTAPSASAILVAQKYEYNAFSDAELNSILSDYGSDINLSAAHCCRALATNAAKFFAYWSGDERVDRSKESENFRKMAREFEDKTTQEQSGQADIGVLRTEIYSETGDTGILQD